MSCLEKIYENALVNRLRKQNLKVEQQFPLTVYGEDGTVLGEYYADLFIETCLIVELKACKAVADEHVAQLLGYLTSSRIETGLLINYGLDHRPSYYSSPEPDKLQFVWRLSLRRFYRGWLERMKTFFHFSLRELLFVVLFAGLGLAALRAGGLLASLTLMLAITMTMCFAIVAFVGRRQLQAFAIGFLVPVVTYAGIVWAVGVSELDPYSGELPTSQLLQPVFEVIVTQAWVNITTGKIDPGYDPATDPNRNLGGGGGGGFSGSSPMRISELPDRQTFMCLGHVLIAMIFGYAGAKFAVGVHRRQRT